MFDVNIEANIPTLYSTLALVLLSLLLTAVGVSARGKERRTPWLTLAALFALAAVNETADFHEAANDPLRSVLGTGGFLNAPVILPGALLAAIAATLFHRFARGLPAPVQRLSITGGLLFVGGAVVIEGLQSLVEGNSVPTLESALVGTLSELCEMLGVALIIEASLLYIALERRAISVTVRPTTQQWRETPGHCRVP